MSRIDGKHCWEWIHANEPKDGWFRAYWKGDVEKTKGRNSAQNQTIGVYSWDGGATLNKEEGNGLRYEWFLENGKVIGTSKSYHPNGILKETREWGNGIKNGWQRWYYDNSQIMRECFYIDNKEHGLRPYWFADGKKFWEKRFKMGVPHGIWKKWWMNGNLRMETEYVDGIEVKERKLYTENGVLES